MACAALFSAAVGFIAFAPALRNEFVYDDLPIVVENRTVTEPGAWYRFWREPWWPRGTSNDRLYRPLTLWSFRANIILQEILTGRREGLPALRGQYAAAPDPFWFHLVNLVIHGLTAAGVAVLAYRLSGRAGAAWAAGLLFAAHPLNAESVVTAYGRAELLAGFFGVWLLARYLKVESRKSKVERLQRKTQIKARGVWFHVVNGLLLLAAMMSKEHAVFIWPVLLLIDLWRRAEPRPSGSGSLTSPPPSGSGLLDPTAKELLPLGRDLDSSQPLPHGRGSEWRTWLNRTIGPAHLPFALAGATFLFLRFSVFTWKARIPGSDLPYWQAPLGHASLIEHVLTPFRLLWLTVELLVWPPRLCPIWSVPALPLASRLSPDVIAGMAVLLTLLLSAVVLWRKRLPAGVLILGLILLLLLPLQAIPLANWLFAERWLYLPTIVVAALVGAAAARLNGPGLLLGTALTVLLLPATWAYTSAYRDNLAMLRDVARRQPDNLQAAKNLTGAMLVIGDNVAAVQHGWQTIERFGDIPDVYLYLTQAYIRLGDGESALRSLDRFFESTAGKPGLGYGELRRTAELLAQQQHARTSAPGSTPDPQAEAR